MRFPASLVICASVALATVFADQAGTTKPKAPAPQKATAPAGMTNNDVIQMVAAGLSDQLVMSAIERAPSKRFDLSVAGLIALKKASVSEALIMFMQTGAAPVARAAVDTSAPPPVAPAISRNETTLFAAVPASVRNEDGVYYLNGTSVERIEAKTPYQTRTGSTAIARLTFGIKKKRLNAMLPGLTADLHVSQTPRFYVHLAENESVGEYYLIKFTVKQAQGRRELEVGSAGLGKAQAGFAEKDIFLIDAKRVEKDLYLVTPKIGLSVGEYSLLVVPQASISGQTGLTPRKIFDFSVR